MSDQGTFALKFAVVREDPNIETLLVKHSHAHSILLVGSGGCTALHLKHSLPHLRVVVYDFNPAQLAHIESKRSVVAKGDNDALNVENSHIHGLNQCGAFEKLFRVLRLAFLEWIAPVSELEYFFTQATQLERRNLANQWCCHRYWPSIFASVFHDPLLHAMFGPDATQHALPGSYPHYFQKVFEQGFMRTDAGANPFLQHIFLGYYLRANAPSYVNAHRWLDIELRHATLLEIPDLHTFDVVHLSNIFDWSGDALVHDWAQHLQRLRSGAWVLTRQLNNQRNLYPFLGETFVHHEQMGESWLREDRSLFYENIGVWQRK